jgi:uncharacterized protein
MPALTILSTPPDPEHTLARVGLIADTHMPERLRNLPETVFAVFASVDLVLHAGDVGDLSVLDALSHCAPVIAVHGNDESVAAQQELPYQQVLAIGGQRLLLTHAHYPDRAEELHSRRDDRWEPKLERRAAMGQRAGAQIVIFGHTHIPMVVPWGELLLINPGGLASGNYLTRQVLRSVAILTFDTDGGIFVEHRDLDAIDQPLVPKVDLAAGFRAALASVSVDIAEPEVYKLWQPIRALFEPGVLSDAEQQALHQVFARLAFPRWAGQAELISQAELLAALQTDLAPSLWTKIETVRAG